MSAGRKVRYGVAMSLDGYIAGPNGEYDWIVDDAEVDASLVEVWSRFGTLLMGRRTYELAKPMLTEENLVGKTVAVASRTLPLDGSAAIEVIRELDGDAMRRLREQGGKDIWLFGGGEVFRRLLQMGEVDGVDLSIVPVLLGGGIRLLPELEQRTQLTLTAHRVFPSGMISLSYDVKRKEDQAACRV